MVYMHVSARDEAGPIITIDCPACGRRRVNALAYDHSETPMLFFVVPFFTHTTTWVVCEACGSQLYSRVSAQELASMPPSQVSSAIGLRRSAPAVLLAILSPFLAIVPGLGLVVALLAVLLNRKRGGWVAALSWVGLVLAVLALLVFAWLAIISRGD